MKRILGLLLLGGFFALIQTVLWPQLFGWQARPDLILVLVVYVGLTESLLGGGLLVLLFGAGLDALSGSNPGLHMVVLLLVFDLVRFFVGRFNAENATLLLFMVACGTLVDAVLLLFFASFADPGPLGWEVVRQLAPQLLLNLVSAWLLLRLAPWLQRRLVPMAELPGLNRLDRRHGA
ncbi:rod shape-determining protein MreD [Geothermobacter hydrogeniphilus]|uniref:Rod shape-determining protein MreD n=1 Tax=Geothermobacter hydrogeniphilus TaxID=1969733 RepID=A0A1X0YCY6_9BACT|nr:rod shape-determining protein MreD [Geothermobacter hydrogeniphilus]ORJ62987.1 rod shape-determining protein MreD [Geothermobacter hydrogeniphilus]